MNMVELQKFFLFFFSFSSGATRLSRYFQFLLGMKEADVSFLAGDLEENGTFAICNKGKMRRCIC